MRKSLLLVGLLLCAMTGCGNTSTTEATTVHTVEEQSVATKVEQVKESENLKLPSETEELAGKEASENEEQQEQEIYVQKKVIRLFQTQKTSIGQLVKEGLLDVEKMTGASGTTFTKFESEDEQKLQINKKGVIRADACGTVSVTCYWEKDGVERSGIVKFHTVYSRFFQKNELNLEVSDAQRDEYLSQSAFVGNSVSLGLTYYMDSQPDGFMGNPLMLTVGCYSFYNDESGAAQYRISYGGRTCTAREAIKASGVKAAFICMGTNDIGCGAQECYKNYVKYLKGIRSLSPELVIFIEAATPVCQPQGHVNNENMDGLNDLLKALCEKQKNMYYIDINTPLKSGASMNPAYSSDKYVHMNNQGYQVWCRVVSQYVKNLLKQEYLAEDAVITAVQTQEKKDIESAEKRIQKLKASAVKDELVKQLKEAQRHRI